MKHIFSKKFLFTTAIFALVILTQTSCKKDCVTPRPITPTSTYPIQGQWTGLYTVDGINSYGQQYYSYIIKTDGTIICESKGNGKQYLATGTWVLNGKILSTTIKNVYVEDGIPHGISQTSTSTWDSTGKLSNGIWKNVAPITGQGQFNLTRIN